MSTMHYGTDELAKLCLTILTTGGDRHEVRAWSLEQSIEDLSNLDWWREARFGMLLVEAANYSQANTKAVHAAARYRKPDEVATTAEELRERVLQLWEEQQKSGWTMLNWLATIRRQTLKFVSLLQYNLDECETLEALRFCLEAVESRANLYDLDED